MEMLHESGPRVVYRAVRNLDGEQVILKTLLAEYPHKQDLAEIRREFQIANRLNIHGVIRVHSLQTYGAGNLALEMEHFGISLADFMVERQGQSIGLNRFFSIAVNLARILGQLHENGIIHKDVVPTNILMDPDSGELRLIDFGISSELSRERQSITLSKRLEGSLPYISPEQTGRMNRDVDYRSDYYLLGVTLFELLTGKLPFAASNTLEWVHRHISQSPPMAHEVNSEVPEQVSQIILKLMSKNAEDRYQSTYGLITDFERCRDEIERNGIITCFELGKADVSRRFQISQQLYGRDKEMEQIEALFDDVANGGAGLCLVSGYSGVGKSALVNEFGKSVVCKQGYLIQSKFDKFHQNSAYSAIADAFRGLVQQLLSEPEGCLDKWRKTLQDALGLNGQLLINLVPELELIIGEQPPVPDLPPTESQNRFQIVFLNFVKVFASRQHPLTIFMDDLQWSDVPTLNLIQRLLTARDLNYLFFVGAYRSNVVDERHPLRIVLNQIQNSRELTELMLEPLDRDAVDQLIADTLHTDLQSCELLGEIIYQKTHANPFFINEFIKSLNEDALITFDPETGSWNWDIESVQHAEVGDNVVDFLISSLRRLDQSTQQVLQLAACIGSSFDLRTLSIIYEQSMEQTSQVLNKALRRNIVLPLNESYKFFGLGSVSEDAESELGIGSSEDLNPCYKFQHDHLQQAAYALIDSSLKQAVHLSVGRLIQSHCSDQERSERLIEIVEHMNEGRSLMDDSYELRQLACLNLDAGIKAQQSSVYRAALSFFQIGQELLADDAWEKDYDLMLALSREIQQCTYLIGEHEEADTWTEKLLLHARSPLLKAEILSARTRQYATTGRMSESIQAAFAGLSLLGIDMIDYPDATVIDEEAAEVRKNLGGRSIPGLITAPDLTNPEVKAAIHLLMEIFPAAFLSGSGNLFPYLVLKSVNLSLRHGNSPESAFAYAAYGMLLCGVLEDPALGYEYGKLGVAMNERFNDIELKSRIIYVYAMFIHHWNNHWSSMTPWFLKGIEAGYQSGDMLYLAYSAQDCIIWDPKLDLDAASREQRKYLTIVKDCEYQDSLDSGTLFLQMQLNFQGLTDDLYSMDDDFFNEAQCVEGMQQRRFMTGIANYNIYKAEIHFFYDDFAGALEYIEAQDDLIASAMSLPQLVRFYIVAFLTRAALFNDMQDSAQQVHQQRLQTDLQQMMRWAEVCPENFHHLCCIMQAELARLAGDIHGALSLYEQAITSAKASEFRRDEALANEQ
ncbi:MAG: serine/threonine-protein kinase PknK, partial [Gammaproteobacteria bacterium]|nr:serine/threonine-protein kinase PknK [Gammaproteobacteria bacterium]